MALDQEQRRLISRDLADLCEYEAKDAMSESRIAADMVWRLSTTSSAELAKWAAEQRLEILRSLGVKSSQGQDDYAQIQKCIRELDGFIVRDPYAEYVDDEVEE